MNLVELAKSLIEINTEVPPGNEELCARYIREVLSDMHADGAELSVERFEHGRANLVAGFGPSEPGLLLGGHMDVVPAEGESAWAHPPFEGVTDGGRPCRPRGGLPR